MTADREVALYGVTAIVIRDEIGAPNGGVAQSIIVQHADGSYTTIRCVSPATPARRAA